MPTNEDMSNNANQLRLDMIGVFNLLLFVKSTLGSDLDAMIFKWIDQFICDFRKGSELRF